MNPNTPPARKSPLKRRGRPKIYRSESARVKATRARNSAYQTSEGYKAYRKNRYATDPEYRQRCQQRAREFSEQQKSGEMAEYAKRVNSGIRWLGRIGTSRKIEVYGMSQITFTIAQCAEVLCRPAGAVREWIKAGRFPRPTLLATNPNNQSVHVYNLDQTRALAEAAVAHLRTGSAHLTATRKDAIVAFHQAMRE